MYGQNKGLETHKYRKYLHTHTNTYMQSYAHAYIYIYTCKNSFYTYTLLAKKVVTPPLKTIKPMWIEFLCFHLAEIGMIWTHDCSPTKYDITLGRQSMQGQVGSSSSETTV